MSSLHDRLLRLKHAHGPAAGSGTPRCPEGRSECAPAGAGAGTSPLERLEQELLGELVSPRAEGDVPSQDSMLTLKARLERLVAVASAKETERRRVRGGAVAARPLEELVDGMRVENERGEFFRIEHSVHLDERHGLVPLSRVRGVRADTVRILSGDPTLDPFDLGAAAFLDTETTGLAGGAGTAAFLIGVGWFAEDRFHVRQYFMRDYHEEPALLFALAEDLRRFERLVTFNGKMFDLPLLDTRFRLSRRPFALDAFAHLDLLHPARRLWKMRVESCRLQSLEVALLGLRRSGDIPGQEIPAVYFDWVRRRDARMLARVIQHNRQDIVSLAALAVLACQWIEEDCAADPRDVFSLARVFERAGQGERSREAYERVLDLDEGSLRGQALLRLAAGARRSGDAERLVRLASLAAEAGEPEGWRELAKHHEHRTRDLELALAAAERGLALVEGRGDPRARRLAEGLEKRRARLLRRGATRARGAGSRGDPR